MKTYRISALGWRFGLSRSTLLYYDRIGLLSPGARSDAGYRLYTEADVARLERICALREAGFSLDEIARQLAQGTPDRTVLERRLREINREMAALRARQRLVAGMLHTVAAGAAASGLDEALWLSLQRACGLDEAALQRWHTEFERRAPQAHHNFLLGLGLSEKEALQIRMLTRDMRHNTTTMRYFYEVFEALPRQGPGCEEATLRALAPLRAALPAGPRVLDIGCGCGAQTLVLARALDTTVIAIDNHRPVLDRLDAAAAQAGLRIDTRELSMIDLPFAPGSFDLLWAEGALFIIGIARGLQELGPLLKPGGFLAFTEMCWLTPSPPDEVRTYFERMYPDMRSADALHRLTEESGYRVLERFTLPDSAWWDDYYTPMLERVARLRHTHRDIPEAQAVYAACETEADMFRRHAAHYGYVFFVLQRP